MLEPFYEINLIRVDSEPAFVQEIAAFDLDVIISDFSLPSYSGNTALETVRSRRPDVPFIFFSGTLGEDAAVEALRSGATDYILKHRPQKMIAAIERALRESDEREIPTSAQANLRETPC